MDDLKTETYRQYFEQYWKLTDVFWGLFYKSVTVIIVLLSVPFLYEDAASKIGAIYFPSMAIVVSIVSTWLLTQHYYRMKSFMDTLGRIRSSVFPELERKKRILPLILCWPSVGGFVPFAVLVGGLSVSTLVLFALTPRLLSCG